MSVCTQLEMIECDTQNRAEQNHNPKQMLPLRPDHLLRVELLLIPLKIICLIQKKKVRRIEDLFVIAQKKLVEEVIRSCDRSLLREFFFWPLHLFVDRKIKE